MFITITKTDTDIVADTYFVNNVTVVSVKRVLCLACVLNAHDANVVSEIRIRCFIIVFFWSFGYY